MLYRGFRFFMACFLVSVLSGCSLYSAYWDRAAETASNASQRLQAIDGIEESGIHHKSDTPTANFIVDMVVAEDKQDSLEETVSAAMPILQELADEYRTEVVIKSGKYGVNWYVSKRITPQVIVEFFHEMKELSDLLNPHDSHLSVLSAQAYELRVNKTQLPVRQICEQRLWTSLTHYKKLKIYDRTRTSLAITPDDLDLLAIDYFMGETGPGVTVNDLTMLDPGYTKVSLLIDDKNPRAEHSLRAFFDSIPAQLRHRLQFTCRQADVDYISVSVTMNDGILRFSSDSPDTHSKIYPIVNSVVNG
ncbi:MAG: hypothetical protein Q4P66_03865 [Actinomycetaceae bacterium]|nr:hypothetical protein [Actinomycetaceae bacterium]